MLSAHDVVAFIRRERGPVGGFKLQKLLYYSQAWSLVWDDAALFPERIEAWIDGPAVRSVWGAERYGGREGDEGKLSVAQQETVMEVLRVYARHNGDWLSALTHRERPWLEARGATPGAVASADEITHERMKSFYAAAGIPAKTITPAYHRGLQLLVALPEHEAARLFDHQGTVSGNDAIAWLSGKSGPSWRDRSV